MKIAKFEPNDDWVIQIPKCVTVISIGVQEDVPIVLAIVADPGESIGKDMEFYLKMVGDTVTSQEINPQYKRFVAGIMGQHDEWLVFTKPTSILQEVPGAGPVPQGMTAPGFMR